MSGASIVRIFERFERKLDGLNHIDDPVSMLRGLFEELSRSHAEAIFLKTQTEPGWDDAAVEAAMQSTFHDHAMCITDFVHGGGGDVEMAQDLVKAAAIAFGGRFLELHASLGGGGVA